LLFPLANCKSFNHFHLWHLLICAYIDTYPCLYCVLVLWIISRHFFFWIQITANTNRIPQTKLCIVLKYTFWILVVNFVCLVLFDMILLCMRTNLMLLLILSVCVCVRACMREWVSEWVRVCFVSYSVCM